MVGAAVAALLRSNAFTADMRIAIIDHQPPPMELTVSQYPDVRVSTITPANMQLLQQTGAWQELAQLAPTFQHMQVWEHAGPGFISWQASDIGHPHMGYVAPRLALVGDAAHSIHPMAGQGVNLGLGDAAALAETLAHARELGRDLGDLALLQSRYEAPRQRANMTMIAALEVLWRGFGVQAGLAGAARSAGLGLLNGVGPVKNRIMQYAMGLTQ
ncbi:hypothetical protein OEZ85_002164 [Tetradesmus obliquus]|uniref:FAD-binding domain-containing protein n=1 Tax=Tetradesmus obliquus TaxID=3088 RepID=A0ABY8U2T9_TETOB|nr:hypothetical protein OEZ85_002164 [Tetradesmus obliquus]